MKTIYGQLNSCRLLGSLLVCIMLGLLAAPVWAQDEDTSGVKTVVVDGTGAGADKAKARDEAIVDAQRKAVEQGVGLYLKSDTIVANMELISDVIYRHVDGYVHSYTVNDEHYNADNDLYWVRITAKVRAGKISDDLTDLADRLKVPGNPRIIIAIAPPANDDVRDNAQSTLTARLVEIGFKVLDADQMKTAQAKEALKMLRDGQDEALNAMALQDRADMVIVGGSSYKDPQTVPGNEDNKFCQATLAVRAIRTDTGHIIAATAGKGVGAGQTTDDVIDRALAAASKDWIKKNLPLLVRAIVDPSIECNLNITGCTHEDFMALDAGLAESRFVQSTDLVAFDNEYAQMTVRYLGSVKNLSKDVARINGLHVTVDSVTNRTIRAHIKHHNND